MRNETPAPRPMAGKWHFSGHQGLENPAPTIKPARGLSFEMTDSSLRTVAQL
jgi:hypothetical protein